MDTDSATNAAAAGAAGLTLPLALTGDPVALVGFVIAVLALAVRLIEAVPPAARALRSLWDRRKG